MNPGTKPNETIYTYSEAELQGVLAGLKKAGRRYQDPIQRYKGLGEMDADQLASTTMDRRYRTLRRVRVRDAELPPGRSSCSWATTSRRARNSSSPAARH